jgi:hypothetical protein
MRRQLTGRTHHAIAALVVAGGVAVAGTIPAQADPAGSEPSTPAQAQAAKAKKCGKGKTRVKRKGRKSVCAKKCKTGFKHKVSKKGKVSCARTRRKGSTPAPQGGGGPASGNYSGNTEQNRTLSFTVAGGQVTNFQAGVNTYCSTQGNSRFMVDAIANIPPMPIGPDGSFSHKSSAEGNPEIAGRIVGGKATGTVGMNRGDSNFVPGEGLKFGVCSASGVTWSATGG